MNRRLTLACRPYDRIAPLRTGEIRPEGVDLTYLLVDDYRTIFARMVKSGAYDLSEMAGMYAIGRLMQGGDVPFVALPVFPSRSFRHGFVFVNASSGIDDPKDLEGRRVGVTEFRNTAAVWIRGLLQNEYGVDLGSIEWFHGELNGRESPASDALTIPFEMARPVISKRIRDDTSLSDMLAEGRLDAVIGPRIPNSLHGGNVRRLFENSKELEADYYLRTGVFPIMHVIVMRVSLYEDAPWVARAMFGAFEAALQRASERLRDRRLVTTMLPWESSAVAEWEDMGGEGMWRYGVEANRATLETFVTYLVQQGFVEAPTPVERLFVPVEPAVVDKSR